MSKGITYTTPIPLKEFFTNYNTSYDNDTSPTTNDYIIYDPFAFKFIPELNADFTIPSIFQNFDNSQTVKDGRFHHVLSIGVSRTG